MGLFSFLRNTKIIPDQEDTSMALFDKKFKTIVKCPYDDSCVEKIEWLNLNTSGLVDIRVLSTNPPPLMVIGFEDDSDALIFKIKYL